MTDENLVIEKVADPPLAKKITKRPPRKKPASKIETVTTLSKSTSNKTLPKSTSSRRTIPAKKTAQTKKATRNYPQITIEKCLIIAQKIKELNGGNTWSPKDISKAIGVGVGNTFYYYTASSRDFGFTTRI